MIRRLLGRGAAWLHRRRLERFGRARLEEGRQLASWRDDLVAEGHDPAELAEPVDPGALIAAFREHQLAAWDRLGPEGWTRAPISETHYELRSWRGNQLTGQYIVHQPGWQDDEEGDALSGRAGVPQPEITWGPPGSSL